MKIKLPLTLTLLALVVALAVGLVAFSPEGTTVSADQPTGVSTVLGDGIPLPVANSKVGVHHIPGGDFLNKHKELCLSATGAAMHVANHPRDHYHDGTAADINDNGTPAPCH